MLKLAIHHVALNFYEKLTVSIIIALRLVGSSVLAEKLDFEDGTSKGIAERERLIRETNSAWLDSEQSKRKEFLSGAEKEPLKKKYYQAVLQHLTAVGRDNFPEELVKLAGGKKLSLA